MGMDRATYEHLFFQALRIRMVEEKIVEIYPSDRIQSPVHLSIGQEHHVVALVARLRKEDALFCSYRGHAAYLAKGGCMRKMFAELYGRRTGISKGKAGSMHLCAPEVTLFGASAIVGTVFPHALGSAYVDRVRREGRVSAVIAGDGATEEGVFHESLNFAALKQLPILFVIENNDLAIHSVLGERQSYSLRELAGAHGIDYFELEDGFDLERIWFRSGEILSSLRKVPAPALLHIRTYRYYEHVGVGLDYDRGYRAVEDYEGWRKRDPLIQNTELVGRLRPQIESEIEEAVLFAEKSPLPGQAELLTDVV